MGNTKYIWFEGDCAKENLSQFEKTRLLDVSHGSYCAVEIDPEGYLGENDFMKETDAFMIGIIHSYSMVGLHLLDHLKLYLKTGSIGYLDSDWPDLKLYRHFDDGTWKEVKNLDPDVELYMRAQLSDC